MSTVSSTAVVCGPLTRPWPPIYSRLASAIRPARRAVDEHAAGAGLREGRSAKAPPNSLSPTYPPYPPYPPHSASLTYHRAHTSPRSLRVLHSSFSPPLTGCLFPALDITVHTTLSWQHTHSLHWTGTERLHQPTLFTTAQAKHASTTRTTTGSFTHASQPWNNDRYCQYHSLHCALSLSHVWRARKNAIVYCYCSAIVIHKADVPWLSIHTAFRNNLFAFPTLASLSQLSPIHCARRTKQHTNAAI